MKSFLTLDSDYKADKGGRGVGRLLWLKAFRKVNVSSIYKLKYIRFIILHIILSKGYRPYSEHFLCKLLILINISLSLCFADSYSRISAGRKSCDGPPVFLSIKYEPCTYWLSDCLFYKNYLIFRQDKLLTVRFPERRRNSRQPSGSCPGCRNSPSTVWFDLTYNHKIR